MNRNQLLLLLVLVAVIGGAGLLVNKKKAAAYKGGDRGQTPKLLADFDVNKVAQISIRDSQTNVSLVRQNDRWVVESRGGYPANFNTLSDVVRKCAELKIMQSEKVGASQRPRLELVEPAAGATNAGTVVLFKDETGKPYKSLLLGKKHSRQRATPSPFGGGMDYEDGRYVLVMDNATAQEVALVSDAMNDVQSKPDQWLDKEFFKADKLKSIAVAAVEATNSWSASRENESAPWVLADVKAGEDVDTNKLSGFSSALSSPSFMDVVIGQKPEDTGLDKPAKITIETFDQFTYTIQVGKYKADEDRYYMTVAVAASYVRERPPVQDEKPEDKTRLDKEFKENVDKLDEKLALEKKLDGWVYSVTKWTLDPVFKTRAELMVEKKDEKADEGAAAEPKEEGADEAPMEIKVGP